MRTSRDMRFRLPGTHLGSVQRASRNTPRPLTETEGTNGFSTVVPGEVIIRLRSVEYCSATLRTLSQPNAGSAVRSEFAARVTSKVGLQIPGELKVPGAKASSRATNKKHSSVTLHRYFMMFPAAAYGGIFVTPPAFKRILNNSAVPTGAAF